MVLNDIKLLGRLILLSFETRLAHGHRFNCNFDSRNPMTDKTEIWIIKGYEIFAFLGEKGLIIEKLSKEVGISKS